MILCYFDMNVHPFRAGASLVLHKDAAWKEGWNKFKETNPILRGLFGMKKSLEETDNPLANTGRAVSGRITNILGKSFAYNSISMCYYLLLKFAYSIALWRK
jgi:hypothetical protein